MAKRGRGHRSIQGGWKNFAQPDHRILRRTACLKIAFQIPFAATMLVQTFVERVSLVLFSLDLPAPLLRVCILCVRVCVCVCVFRAVLRAGFSSRFGKRWEPMFARPILAARFFHLRVECQSTAMCADRQRIPSRRLRLLRDRKHSCPCIPASDCLALVA